MAAAQRDPDRPAVVGARRTLTYGELERESAMLANALVDHGVAVGDRVGLLLEKSPESLVGIYGILRAGATYVPLDDQAPVPRVAYIARDAGIRCLVTSPPRLEMTRQLRAAGAELDALIVAGDVEEDDGAIRQLGWPGLADYPADAPSLARDPDRLAYILYTSGSTGEPKGVMLSHRNARSFVDWAAREVGVGEADRLSSHAPLFFDLSTFDLFAAAWGGATVVLVPSEVSIFPIELARFIRESQITVWYSVPSILTLLVLRGGLEPGSLETLRTVLFAGEVFPTKYLRALMDLVPRARFLNLYGPTETNVCTWYEVPRALASDEAIPIGRAIDGVDLIVEAEDGAPAAAGEVGELLVRGPTVMHGYWGDPERTSRVLHGGTYRTGDLVRDSGDGELVFLGRRDAQVKTRGYRVELGDVETALYSLPAVVECVVVAIPDDAITNRLKAFVVAGGPLNAGDLAARCRELLPRYMVPDEFELRESLPKSATGKIDRRRLEA
ncbi:MAG: amino acid adenylation domain-containing protein [Solirubrobacteraceae bacterium]